jgi:hypothetical protein
LAKPNYRHAKKQKEAARKARQDAKQQRKNAPDGSQAPDVPTSAETLVENVTEHVPLNTDA